MDLGLTGKKTLVLASSRGLGLGIAEALTAEGADVLLTGRNEAALEKAVAEINARGQGKASWTPSDLFAANVVDSLAGAAEAKLGRVDILVANTGGPPFGTCRWRATKPPRPDASTSRRVRQRTGPSGVAPTTSIQPSATSMPVSVTCSRTSTPASSAASTRCRSTSARYQ